MYCNDEFSVRVVLLFTLKSNMCALSSAQNSPLFTCSPPSLRKEAFGSAVCVRACACVCDSYQLFPALKAIRSAAHTHTHTRGHAEGESRGEGGRERERERER